MKTADGLDEALRPYLAHIAPIVGDGYPGADVVANWYRRNLHITVVALRSCTHRASFLGGGILPSTCRSLQCAGSPAPASPPSQRT